MTKVRERTVWKSHVHFMYRAINVGQHVHTVRMRTVVVSARVRVRTVVVSVRVRVRSIVVSVSVRVRTVV